MILGEKIKKTDYFRKTSYILMGNILNFDIYDTKTEYFILNYTSYRYLHVSSIFVRSFHINLFYAGHVPY